MPAPRRSLGIHTSTELLRRLQTLERADRYVGRPTAFTEAEVHAFLETRRRGVSWRACDDLLPLPYAEPKGLSQAVLRAAKRYGIDTSDIISRV